MSDIALPSIFAGTTVASYMQKIRNFPLLSQEEELKLIMDWIEKSDIKAAHKLVTSHLRLVVKIALKFRDYGLPLMDIISEGNIGLMKAVKKFRPEKGNRLSTYAMWWIRACIQDYIVKSWSMVKVSSSILQKKLFSSLENLKKKIGYVDDAKAEKKEGILNNSCYSVSLNKKLGYETETELMDIVSDDSQNHEECIANNQEKNLRLGILKNAISGLSDREQDIIKQRKLSEAPVTLDVLSRKYNVSSERIRQIEEVAIKKIKQTMALA